ncbi:hypothetical protein BSL78_20829 [Apostichopus japonicus]|uniref:PKD domain-containing protein n=1 Tax=Stichopus japonicus TaxID=307972 RepID=A0A2G8K2X2_STIJA|nr:hypothetical protein BSL78_20829 [Apostichopus japonicus]
MDMPYSRFISMDMPYSRFISMDMPYSRFISMDMPYSRFISMDMPYSRFISMDMPYSRFISMDMPYSRLISMDMPYSRFISFQDADKSAIFNRLILCISDLSVVSNLINLNFLQEFSVSVWIGAGDSVEYTWDFGDAVYTTQRQAATIQESDNKTHSYSSYGPQQITVTAANNCGNLTESIIVNVFGTEQPIQRHHYDITPSSPIEHPFPSEAEFEFTFTLTVPFGEVLGTNVSVHISTSYYENSTADLFDLYVDGNSKKVSHFVRFTGIHTAQVTLTNPISEEVFEIEIESQERLSLQSSFQPMYILPVSSEDKLVPGYGNEEDSFPVEYPIYFIADVPHGTGVEFRVISFDDASPPTILYPSSEPISHQFSSPGRYDVTVEIANSVSAPVVTSKTIYLYESISNMQIIEGPQTGAGMEKRLMLNIDNLGYHPCIVVDFDDGELEYYGNETTCVAIAGYEGAGYAGPFTTNLDHTYLEAGTKHVQIQAHNLVSNLREDIFFVVGEGDCRSPNLYIRDGYRYFNGPRIVLRTDFTYLRGATVLDCSLTDNVKYWFLSEYDPYNGTAIPGSEVNLTSLSPGQDLYIPSGTSSSEIRLPPTYYLPVGFYRFTYTVVMNDFTQTVDLVLAFVHEYIEVRQGVIQARIIEGPSTFTTLGSNQSLLLRPGNFSRDLDLEDQVEQTFDEFRYFCKRFYEEWPLNDNATIASGYFVSAGMVDFGGCFDEGPGRLDIAAPLYLLRGSELLVNMTYNILVEVEREGRIGTTNLTILVVEGSIPRPIITFEENVVVEDDGTVSLNPTEALRLDAKCDGDCEDVTVEWSFQIFNGTHYIEIDGWDLYSTGNVTQELYLSEDFYKDLVPYGSDLRIQALMTSPSALGFDQEEGETVSEDLQLFFGRHPKSRVLPPLGDSSNEYRLQLSVIITDTRGAWATYDLGFIQVYPSSRIDALLEFNANLSQQYDSLRDAQDTFQINERILLDGALLNQYRSNSINKMNYDLAALGLSSDAIQDEGTASSPLEDPDEVVKITQSRESDRIKSAYLRSRLAKLTEQAPVSSVDDVIGVASATLTLTHAPEEQSHQFLESTSNSMLKMVDTMETVSDKESGSKVLFAGFKMLICIGNMYQGSAKSIDDPMLIIDEHEQSEDQSYGSLFNRIQESSVAATEASQTNADGAIEEEKRNKVGISLMLVTQL